MATTTNYSWTTPDDTALVKDGAAAIRTLGSSVDTTTKALNPSTTLGDIEYRSATANTNTRLALGTAGQILTVNSGANAPEWQTSNAGGMTLISTTTLSGATTTLSSIPQTYNSLFLVIAGMTGNTGAARFRCGLNGSSTAQSYSFINLATAGNISGGYIRISEENTTRTDANNAWTLQINNYSSTTGYKPFNFFGRYLDSTAANRTILAGGAYIANTAVSSIVFDYEGTNTFAGGTVLLYGVK
jgi:hypothetical protein